MQFALNFEAFQSISSVHSYMLIHRQYIVLNILIATTDQQMISLGNLGIPLLLGPLMSN